MDSTLGSVISDRTIDSMQTNGQTSGQTDKTNDPNNKRNPNYREVPTRMEADEHQERQHFFDIVNTFKYYKTNGLNRVAKTHRYLDSLPEHHQKMLTTYRQHLEEVSKAIEQNYRVIESIVADISGIFENIDYTTTDPNDTTDDIELKTKTQSSLDSDKVNSILKQIVREWTDEGSDERKTCFEPILNQIDECFSDCEDKSAVHVLVPGAGLGRLPLEIARRGYSCQGNEYSLFMLFTSNFILNKCKHKYVHTFYPWAQHYTNNLRSSDQLCAVRFPDINPAELPESSDFSMAAGSFTEIYGREVDSWHCVSTCFFIDTANNVTEYIETVWKVLKPGGVWINLGPLLYHYADISSENSIEPSFEIIREIIIAIGFEIIKEKTNVTSYYTQNPLSMLAYEYRSVFFVCKKPIL